MSPEVPARYPKEVRLTVRSRLFSTISFSPDKDNVHKYATVVSNIQTRMLKTFVAFFIGGKINAKLYRRHFESVITISITLAHFCLSQFMSCVRVEVVVLGCPS